MGAAGLEAGGTGVILPVFRAAAVAGVEAAEAEAGVGGGGVVTEEEVLRVGVEVARVAGREAEKARRGAGLVWWTAALRARGPRGK